jgi:hypothetical protein
MVDFISFQSKWYDFRIFQSKYADSGNSYKQLYNISRKYYRIVQEGIFFNEDYSF